MKHYLLLILVTLSLNACGLSCNKLPSSFSSYSQATILVKKSSFKIKETANTSNSSWIKGAKYYSCNGKIGFLIIKTNRKEYIHSNMPISKWKGLKNATSLGRYYNANIKGRYQLRLR